MLPTRRMLMVAALFLGVLPGGGLAQLAPAAESAVAVQPARQGPREGGRGPARLQVRGLVKSIDVKASTITVTTTMTREGPAGEKTFTLAKDVEVGVGAGDRRGFAKEARLADLSPGINALLILAADEKTVEAILAEGPMARGTLKSIDAVKRTVTITTQTRGRERGDEPVVEEKTYSVDPGAEVGVDDGRGRRFSVKEAKLGELTAGSAVTLWLTIDQKGVQGILAEGPGLFGTVKSVDAGKNTLTMTTVSRERGGEAEEKTFDVAKNAVVLLDDGNGRRFSIKEGKLADVPVGAVVSGRLSVDQKGITMLRAEGPTGGGRVKSVDAKVNSITVEVFVARGDNPVEKTYAVAKNVRVVIDGAEAKFADVKADDAVPVQLKLSLDQKTVQSITVGRGRGRE